MKRILSTSIASLIAPCYLGRPIPAFGEGDADDPNRQAGLDDQVAGEVMPDFSFIEAAEAGETAPPDAPAPIVATPKPAEATPPPKPPEEAATPKTGVQKPVVKDPLEELEIPPVKPQQETKEQEMPDPKVEAEKAAAEKAEADRLAAEGDAAKKKADDEAAAAVAAGKVPEVKLPTDEEVEAMQLKPGANAKAQSEFARLKNEALKPALAEVKRLKAALEEVGKTPKLTDEQQEVIRRAEEDRAWREAFELENDPKLQTEFKAKSDKVEEDLFKMLQENPRLGMKPEAVEALRKMGLDSDEGREATKKIIAAVKEMDDELLLDEVKDAFKARQNVNKERAARIQELRGKQGDLVAVKTEREKQERTAWASACDTNIVKLVNGKDAFYLKDIPPTATPEEKAALEAHNKAVQEQTVPAMREGIVAIYQRDPEKTMQYLIDAMSLPHVASERDKLATDLQAANDRIAELLRDGSAVRRVSSPSQIQNAPPPKKADAAPSFDPNMSADEAIDAYRKEAGIFPGTQGAR